MKAVQTDVPFCPSSLMAHGGHHIDICVGVPQLWCDGVRATTWAGEWEPPHHLGTTEMKFVENLSSARMNYSGCLAVCIANAVYVICLSMTVHFNCFFCGLSFLIDK